MSRELNRALWSDLGDAMSEAALLVASVNDRSETYATELVVRIVTEAKQTKEDRGGRANLTEDDLRALLVSMAKNLLKELQPDALLENSSVAYTMQEFLGVKLIGQERFRQISRVHGEEGVHFDNAHDDAHIRGELFKAAICYASAQSDGATPVPMDWPWDHKWWKPSDRVTNLTKAGALLAAEIDRLFRTTTKE